MKTFYFFIFLLTIQSCATKKYTKARQLPDEIKTLTEKIAVITNNQKKLLQTKEISFTKNGRIKYSKTLDSLGNIIQETKKKLWFTVESYPDKENYYCKTRWKPHQRERISCYTQKRFKKSEAVYHYNPDGSINKIADHFAPFYSQYYYYTNSRLSKIIIKDKNGSIIDEFLIHCVNKDEKGTCLKEIRISTKTKQTQELLFHPKYN